MAIAFYHRTTAEKARAILPGGFVDHRLCYHELAGCSEMNGVWLSNIPVNEGVRHGGLSYP